MYRLDTAATPLSPSYVGHLGGEQVYRARGGERERLRDLQKCGGVGAGVGGWGVGAGS